jgi:hypothetical protein
MPGSIVPCEGKFAYVSVTGVDKPFDSWALSMSCEKADLSDFDQTEANWSYGLQSASVVLSGPYDDANSLGILPTNEYEVVLGITEAFGISLPVLVTDVRPATKVRDIARVEVIGMVNSNFLENPDIQQL